MINAVNSVSNCNNISMRGVRVKFSTHTPKMREYKEFEFMPQLQKQNSVKSFFKDLCGFISDALIFISKRIHL